MKSKTKRQEAITSMAPAKASTQSFKMRQTRKSIPSIMLGCLLNITTAYAQDAVAPQLVTFASAEYPEASKLAGIEGEVVLELVIEASGTVSKASVVKGAGFGFDEAASAAALKFIFQPAVQNGAPVRASIMYRYRFLLAPQGKKANPLAAPLANEDGKPPGDVFGATDLLDILPPGAIKLILVEKGTRLPIGEAQAFVLEANTKKALAECYSDAKGGCLLSGLLSGVATLQVTAQGYEAMTFTEEVPAEGALELTLRLRPTLQGDGYGVVVRGEKDEAAISKRVISPEELAKLPGSQGDVLKGLQNLPGLARSPAISGLLVVRGAAPEDTQTFLNGMPIPLIYHFGGLNSVISGALLSKLDFFPGVYSVRYGRGVGGIVDAETQPGKDQEYHGSVKVDVYDSGAYAQGGYGEDGTFGVAARRSYIDTILPIFTSGTGFTVAPRYWDYQASTGAKLWGGKGQLVAFGSSDVLDLLIDDPDQDSQFVSSSTVFHQVQASWKKEIAPGLTQSASFALGLTQIGVDSSFGLTSDQATLLGVSRVDWASKLSEKISLSYGLDAQVRDINDKSTGVFGQAPPPPGGGPPSPVEREINATPLDIAAYVEAKVELSNGLKFTPGLRADRFGLSETARVDPRFAGRYDISPQMAIKFGTGLYHQDPTLTEIEDDPSLEPKAAIQSSIGFERSLFDDRVSIDITGYYNYMYNLVAQSATGDTVADTLSNDGLGRVKGIEVLLRYPPDKRFFGWVSYSLSKSERKGPDDEDFVLFNFDQTHILTALGSYKLTKDISLGARFRYATGNPETPVIGSIYNADTNSFLQINGETNSDRVPSFNQLDLRVDKTFRLQRWTLAAYLEVQNVYNRKNPEGSFYNFDFSEQQFFTGLPLIPVFGVKGEF
jgi:TonB family protein